MFDLEKSIAEWRQQMLGAGIKTPVPLEELESHLREEIARRMELGINERQAFKISAAQIGEAALLKREFKKIKAEGNMKKLMMIILALFCMVFGLSTILPQLGQWSRTGVLHNSTFLAMGVVIVVMAGITAFYGMRTYREARGRRLLSLAIIAAGIFYVMPLILEFFQPDAYLNNWMFCIFLAGASVLFFGSCFNLNRRTPTQPAK